MLRTLVNKALEGRAVDHYDAAAYALAAALAARIAAALLDADTRRALRHAAAYRMHALLVMLPAVRRQLQKATDDVRADLEQKLLTGVTRPVTALPADGVPRHELESLLEERRLLDTKHWVGGRVTGAVYHGEQDHMDFVGRVYGRFAFFNPLHATLHPATRQMDAEVVAMVLQLYRGGVSSCGNFTTGGTESILMAMKAYRDWGYARHGITSPNIVVSKTAHAAFFKAGQYFRISVRTARTNAQQEVDVRHVRSLIDRNTVAIVGSAPQYATGTIDPIEELAALAVRRGVGLHVDCCLGGFLLPFMEAAGYPTPTRFDFSVPGVTTISCDPHKYGFAPKGASVVMFANAELRHCMYSFAVDWTGGIYATPTMLGSRPGGVVAATWAAMMAYGIGGYVESTRAIVGAARRIGVALGEVEGLELVGRADACVVAFGTTDDAGFTCYAVADCLASDYGWELASLQNPPAVHLALTLPTSKNADVFVDNLRSAVAKVRADPGNYASTAGIYGMASSLPTSFIEETVKVYLDTMMTAVSPEESASGSS